MNVTNDGFKDTQLHIGLSANGICGTERVCRSVRPPEDY